MPDNISNMSQPENPPVRPPMQPVVASAPVPAKPATVVMKPADYKAALAKQTDEALAAEEKAMAERQQNEKEFMERRHESEKKLFASKREASKEQVDAMGQYHEMWQRQKEETQHAPASERESLRQQQEEERLELERTSGWDVREPQTGDTTIAGFPQPLVKGHPWIRRSGLNTSHLHPSL